MLGKSKIGNFKFIIAFKRKTSKAYKLETAAFNQERSK